MFLTILSIISCGLACFFLTYLVFYTSTKSGSGC